MLILPLTMQEEEEIGVTRQVSLWPLSVSRQLSFLRHPSVTTVLGLQMRLGMAAPAPLWKFYRKTQLHSCYICAEGLGPSRPMLALWQFHLSELLWSVDSAGFWVFFSVCPRPPLIPFPSSFPS